MTKNRILLTLAVLALTWLGAAASKKYPGGRQYIFRYYLTDKQGTTARLDRPQRWLSQRSLERRRRQGLQLDSTDLPVSAAYLRQLRVKGVRLVGTSRWNNTVLLASKDSMLLEALGALPCVSGYRHVWTSPDSVETRVRKKVHQDFNRWDSIHNDTYANSRYQIEMLGGDRLHDAGFDGRGMLIAVLDGGFHNADRLPQFAGISIKGVRDVVYPTGGTPDRDHPLEALFSDTDHGTKVLSIMGTWQPEVYIGCAPRADYWLIRCEDTATEQLVEEDYWAMAAELADSAGADVISSSLGYTTFDNPAHNHTLAELDGQTALISRTAALLAGKGIVLCNSAGNSGMGPWKKIGVPADADQILAVGAVTSERRNAAFSSVGPTQDGRVKPDVMAVGSSAALLTGRGALSHDMGTSFSCPIVSGLVACLWQALPEKTALEIIEMVRRSADLYDQPNNVYGYGLPDFWKAYLGASDTQSH